jgi:hypothetical protein
MASTLPHFGFDTRGRETGRFSAHDKGAPRIYGSLSIDSANYGYILGVAAVTDENLVSIEHITPAYAASHRR